MSKRIAIVMGSDSDLRVMAAATEQLDAMKLSYSVDIVSAHRTPQLLFDFAHSAEGKGIAVIIAGAGGAAHLPGMMAALTHLPVIGVPIAATKLEGQDALLSIVQMPAGVPVATVAIDNARNAAILAAQMLGISDPVAADAVKALRAQQTQQVLNKAQALHRISDGVAGS